MKIRMTGGTGFVGSNIAQHAVKAGYQVLTTFNSYRPTERESYLLDQADMVDPVRS